MLPLSDITVSQPLLHLIPNSVKLPSLGPRQQDDTLFSSLGTFFSEHSFPHDSVVLFFFWFHPFSVLFSVRSRHLLLVPFNTILKRIALPASWRGLLGSSLLYLLSFKRQKGTEPPLWMNFITLTHKFQPAPKLNPC